MNEVVLIVLTSVTDQKRIKSNLWKLAIDKFERSVDNVVHNIMSEFNSY
jgi:hypothetical protein